MHTLCTMHNLFPSDNIWILYPRCSSPGNFRKFARDLLTPIPTHPTDPRPKNTNPVFLEFSFLHYHTISLPPLNCEWNPLKTIHILFVVTTHACTRTSWRAADGLHKISSLIFECEGCSKLRYLYCRTELLTNRIFDSKFKNERSRGSTTVSTLF